MVSATTSSTALTSLPMRLSTSPVRLRVKNPTDCLTSRPNSCWRRSCMMFWLMVALNHDSATPISPPTSDAATPSRISRASSLYRSLGWARASITPLVTSAGTSPSTAPAARQPIAPSPRRQ
jgi:hypothetical protein